MEKYVAIKNSTNESKELGGREEKRKRHRK
jgi:hypothetical protein